MIAVEVPDIIRLLHWTGPLIPIEAESPESKKSPVFPLASDVKPNIAVVLA